MIVSKIHDHFSYECLVWWSLMVNLAVFCVTLFGKSPRTRQRRSISISSCMVSIIMACSLVDAFESFYASRFKKINIQSVDDNSNVNH